MSVTYVKRILIKHDGVYLLRKHSDLGDRYRLYKDTMLSKAFLDGNIRGLDREFVKLIFLEYVQIKGQHPSVMRFMPCVEKGGEIYNNAIDAINREYTKLFLTGKTASKQSKEAKAYRKFDRETTTAVYEQLTDLVEPYTPTMNQDEKSR